MAGALRFGFLALMFGIGAIIGLALVGAPDCSLSGQVQTCVLLGRPVTMEPGEFMAFTHGVTAGCAAVAALLGRALWPSRAA